MMQPKKSGFTLFEFLIYLCLLAMTSVLVGLMCTQFFQSNAKIFQATDTVVSLSILSLQIAHDLHQAPADKNKWGINAHAIAWQGAQQHAWKLQSARIMRVEGQEVAAVADGIDGFTFQLDMVGTQVRGVKYALSKHGIKVERYVALYERLFACTS